MGNTTMTETTVFELVRFVDGSAVPYVPFRAGCTSCCGTADAAPAPVAPRCCH